jgi:hypothetical protein
MKSIIVLDWQKWKWKIQKKVLPPEHQTRTGKPVNVFKFTPELEKYLMENEIKYTIQI